MKSLLFTNATPFQQPPGCAPGRTEVVRAFRKNGRIYRVTLRDKIAVEDPYIVLVKAGAFAVLVGEPFMGTPPSRAVRDMLIKSSVVI